MLDTLHSQTLKSCLADLRKNFDLSLRHSCELAAFVLGFAALDTPFRLDDKISSKDSLRLASLAARICSGEPLAYVLGYVEFYGSKILVDSRVLIPRVETEFLVEQILKKYPAHLPLKVLDLCTGSGCIGLALKKQRPHWSVSLSDISFDALALAQTNAQLNGLEVEFFQGDLFEPFQTTNSFFDLIVSNPPYIKEEEYLELESSVIDYEPKLALSAGVTGLEIYKKIAEQAFLFLKPGGGMAFEIGYNQKEAVKELFSNGFYKNIICEKDLAFHDRFIFLELQ